MHVPNDQKPPVPEMTVCLFGIFDPKYERNRVLRTGFERLGYTVVECRADPRVFVGWRKYIELIRVYKTLRGRQFHYVIVCFPGHTVVWLARLLFGPRIIFDAFISLYDTNVFDRKLYSRWDVRAARDWLWDRTSTYLASFVLLDTNAHCEYFRESFHIPEKKCIRVWVGADDRVFYPRDIPLEREFTVHFHGKYIPVQGVTYIIEAADILRDQQIRFRLLGNGQDFEKIKRLVAERGLEHVQLLDRFVPLEELPSYIASAHVSLGIFGESAKAQRAIPNKVYEAMAMGKAIITADTPALRELMPDAKEVLAVPAADPKALAHAIASVRDDPATCLKLGQEAATLFAQRLSPQRIVQEFISEIEKRGKR